MGIASNFIQRCAAQLDADDGRAIRWLAGYARLLDRTADSFERELGADVLTIRRAMTDATMPSGERALFTGAVAVLREHFESRLDQPWTERGNPFPAATPFHRAYGQLADTAVRRKIVKAVRFAERENAMSLVMMKERIGKTISAAHEFLRRLDSAAWVRVPSGDCMRQFLSRVAKGVGMPYAAGTQSPIHLMNRIESVIGPGKVETLFLDQAHWLWPSDAKKRVPRRWEMLMDWWEDSAVSAVLITTPQHDVQAGEAAKSHKHAYGQILGRVETFTAKDTLSDADIGAIVDLHAADLELNEAERAILIAACKASPGYLGKLRLLIRRIARGFADEQPEAGETKPAMRRRIVAQVAGGVA